MRPYTALGKKNRAARWSNQRQRDMLLPKPLPFKAIVQLTNDLFVPVSWNSYCKLQWPRYHHSGSFLPLQIVLSSLPTFLALCRIYTSLGHNVTHLSSIGTASSGSATYV
jgi:hypothetical protein